MDFKSIYTYKPRPAEISAESEIKCDESLTISQIISLHSRGIPAPVHVYEGVDFEIGDSKYRDEQLNEEYYELENDLSDFNSFTPTSGDLVNDSNISIDRNTNELKQPQESGDFFSEARKKESNAEDELGK